MNAAVFKLGKHSLALDKPHIMGILNVTPDSFYDGGKWFRRDAALKHAERMAAEGASIIDIGGESTRPGALPVGEQEEIDRVLGLVEELAKGLDIPISVDTGNPRLMRLAAAAGASLINDVRSLGAPRALTAAAATKLPVCLMHLQGDPSSMQTAPIYEDVVQEVRDFLAERIRACIQAGMKKERLLIDPGFGFGKTFEHNSALFTQLSGFRRLGCPILVGLSRKSFLGALTGREPQDRLAASVAACALAIARGAWMVRVHDVAASLDALRVAEELMADKAMDE